LSGVLFFAVASISFSEAMLFRTGKIWGWNIDGCGALFVTNVPSAIAVPSSLLASSR
jgi:hypothetical protein